MTPTTTETPVTETPTAQSEAIGTVPAGRVRRVFNFNGTALGDPDPKMLPDDVRKHYAPQYPLMTNATIQGPEIKDGKEIYNFVAAVKTKG